MESLNSPPKLKTLYNSRDTDQAVKAFFAVMSSQPSPKIDPYELLRWSNQKRRHDENSTTFKKRLNKALQGKGIQFAETATLEIQGSVIRLRTRRSRSEHGPTFERDWNRREDKESENYAADGFDRDLLNKQAADSNKVTFGNKHKITEFSASSRRNFQDKLLSISPDDLAGGKFLTVTYHDEWPSPDRAKNDVRALFKRIERYVEKRNKKEAAAGRPALYAPALVWRLEPKDRKSGDRKGEVAPHFHLILLGCPYIPKDTLLNWWREIVSDQSITQLDVQRMDTHRKLMNYISKYVRKDQTICEAATDKTTGEIFDSHELNHMSEDQLRELLTQNPHDTRLKAQLDIALYLAAGGRHWGIEGRDNIHFADKHKLELSYLHEGLQQFIAYCEGRWEFLQERWSPGFRIFSYEPLGDLLTTLSDCIWPA